MQSSGQARAIAEQTCAGGFLAVEQQFPDLGSDRTQLGDGGVARGAGRGRSRGVGELFLLGGRGKDVVGTEGSREMRCYLSRTAWNIVVVVDG